MNALRTPEAIQIRINMLEARGRDNKNIVKKLKRQLRAAK